MSSQNLGVITGKVIDVKTREALPYVNVLVYGTSVGVSTNENGQFTLNNVPLGYNKVQVSFVGFQTLVSQDYLVTNDKSPYIY